MHESRFEGIIIGYENWGDTDRLISFYTPYGGKVEAVARGVRHEKSKLKGHLELLTHGEFRMAKNHGRGVLTDALSYETFLKFCADAKVAYLALAIADMYDAYLYPHAADAGLWQLLSTTLRELMERQHNELLALLGGFARGFLKHLGYLDDGKEGQRSLQTYDALLMHTDILGPRFVAIERGLRQISAGA